MRHCGAHLLQALALRRQASLAPWCGVGSVSPTGHSEVQWRLNDHCLRRCHMQAYCVKDRKKVEIKNPEKVTLPNGRTAVKGQCPICGTTVYTFVKSKA